MGDKSEIQWTDATWNPVVGCSKVSPGCDNCYAISMSRRIEATGNEAYQGTTTDDDWTGLVKTLPERLDQPLRWQKPRRVFVNSMSDLFHPDVPHEFVFKVFGVMRLAARHQFQVLTKRPRRMAMMLDGRTTYGRIWSETQDLAMGGHIPTLLAGVDHAFHPHFQVDNHGVWPFPNVWLGTSIESDRYTFRARHLAETPAAIRFLSLEPLLGPLPSLDLDGIDWVIVGGESGPNHRPIEADWVRDIRDRCVDAGVPFFMKQWGGRTPKAGGRELDGETWDQYPDQLTTV